MRVTCWSHITDCVYCLMIDHLYARFTLLFLSGTVWSIFFLLLALSHCSWTFLSFQALDLIRGKNVLLLMDSSLEGQYANEDATALVELASKCLQYEARDRPEIKFILNAVEPLQKQKEVCLLEHLWSWCNIPYISDGLTPSSRI